MMLAISNEPANHIESLPFGDIELSRWGHGPGRLAMLHASATGPRALARLADAVVDPAFSIVAPSLVGYGDTCIVSGATVVEQNLAIARQCLDAGNTGSRVVFGHSMGGLVALLAARDAQAADKPLDGIVLYDPILVGLLDGADPAHRAALRWDRGIVAGLSERVRTGKPEEGVRGFLEAWNEIEWNALPDRSRRWLVAMAANISREAEATSFFPLCSDELRGIRSPVLILTGERSPGLIHLTAAIAAAALFNAKLQVVESAGHMAPVLEPARVASRITSFLASHGLLSAARNG